MGRGAGPDAGQGPACGEGEGAYAPTCPYVVRSTANATLPPIRPLATIALLAASTVSTHAQSNWTGEFSSDWFLTGNWFGSVPTAGTNANINRVSPNPTVIGSPGAIANGVSVGPNATGILTIQPGGTLNSGSGTIGNLPGGVGTVMVTGAGSSWSNAGDIVVGGLGTGTLTIQNGGTVNSGGGGSVGLVGTGTVTVTGPDSTWNNASAGGLNIGSFGMGTLTIANGGKVINTTPNNANIGQAAGSQGTVTVTGAGSIWSNQFGVNVGNSDTGTLTIADGGIVNVGGFLVVAANPSAVGTLNIGAGAGNPAAAPGTITTPSLAFGAGTGTLNFNHTSASYVFAPVISGTGTVNVLAGTTTLTGANSYSGATNINAGTLRAGALNRFSPNSAVTVASGGTLDLNGFSQTVPSVTNAGLVNMGTGTAPGTVLTTTSYSGTGGTLALNTFLGTDGSPSDRLIIDTGTATGNTGIVVTNAGGPGLLTLADGILVVDTVNSGTTAPGAFSLGAPVVAGPFEYTLERGSRYRRQR